MSFDWLVSTDEQYRVGLEYEFNKKVSATANWDSDFDGGMGLLIKF